MPPEPAAARRQIPSRLDAIPDVRHWIADAARTAGYGDDDVLALEMATAEALSNVVRHAYRGEEHHAIDVTLDVTAARVQLTIVDEGEPFDDNAYVPPDPDEIRESGYGLQLIGDVMDVVDRRRSGNTTTLTLIKHRTQEEDR